METTRSSKCVFLSKFITYIYNELHNTDCFVSGAFVIGTSKENLENKFLKKINDCKKANRTSMFGILTHTKYMNLNDTVNDNGIDVHVVTTSPNIIKKDLMFDTIFEHEVVLDETISCKEETITEKKKLDFFIHLLQK